MTSSEAQKRAEELNGRRPGGSLVTYVAEPIEAATPHNTWGVREYYQMKHQRLRGPIVS